MAACWQRAWLHDDVGVAHAEEFILRLVCVHVLASHEEGQQRDVDEIEGRTAGAADQREGRQALAARDVMIAEWPRSSSSVT
jgi:hypothetical protein